MNGEGLAEELHEGEHYLELLGLKDLAEREITTPNGTIQARDFLDICGEHARPMLVGFEGMSVNHPDYEVARDALRGMIAGYIEGGQPS